MRSKFIYWVLLSYKVANSIKLRNEITTWLETHDKTYQFSYNIIAFASIEDKVEFILAFPDKLL